MIPSISTYSCLKPTWRHASRPARSPTPACAGSGDGGAGGRSGPSRAIARSPRQTAGDATGACACWWRLTLSKSYIRDVIKMAKQVTDRNAGWELESVTYSFYFTTLDHNMTRWPLKTVYASHLRRIAPSGQASNWYWSYDSERLPCARGFTNKAKITNLRFGWRTPAATTLPWNFNSSRSQNIFTFDCPITIFIFDSTQHTRVPDPTYFRLDLESLELCESTEADLCRGAGGGRVAVGDAE